jgi:FkbH-like protein
MPAHVLAVFRENSRMILTESDITAYRINWEPKSSNLKSLAEELCLGLDAFVYLDDDSREYAEISACCPQVFTFQLPKEPSELPRFIRHLWVFDRESLSKEDRRRTTLYRDNKQREEALQQSPSLAEFLATLELRVDLRPAPPDQIQRIAQLSQRTSQFNASGLIFNQFDLQRAIQQGAEVMAIEVSDRFGEYGLVGSVIFRKTGQCFAVEAFYLSCRVLGRGVEQRIMAELGRMALAAGLESIRIHYIESSRNQPFRRFLDQLAGRLENPANGPCSFVITAVESLQAKMTPDEGTTPANGHSSFALGSSDTVWDRTALGRLPLELSKASQILEQINLSNSARREIRSNRVFIAPHDGLEKEIAAEWGSILRLDKVGRSDNFFELGGNSLLLVQLNGNLISRLGRAISVTEMFQYPTVASLARHISGRAPSAPVPETTDRAAKLRAILRGRKLQCAARQY